MSEDRTGSEPGQESPASSDSRNQKSITFIEAFLLPEDQNRLWLAGSIPGSKGVRPVGLYSLERLRKLPDNERHHISAGLYGPSTMADGGRAEVDIQAVPFVVFDDIGRKVEAPEGSIPISTGIEIDISVFDGLPRPSWVMETSAGRHQYGFHFEPALPPGLARQLLAALKRHPLLGPGLHS